MSIVSILEYGARGDGIFDNSKAFSKAFEKENICVTVPKGIWLTGPITLKSGSCLNLQKGAIIRFIDNPQLYTPVKSRWEGIRCWCMHACVYSEDSSNVSVTGEGTLDGMGQNWWAAVSRKISDNKGPSIEIEKKLAELNVDQAGREGGGGGWETQFLRPPLLQFNNCHNVLIEGLSFINSPFWTVHPVFCDNVTIKNINIDNNPDSPNTDAIDIDSCTNVKISGCNISVGDDAITIKSGNGEDGIKANRPTRDVFVENCTVKRAHGGAVIGSETAAGIKDVEFKNCKFIGTDRGIRIKTRRGRAGNITDLKFSNIDIDGCLCPIAINMYYKCGTTETWPFSKDKLPVTPVTPSISNIYVNNVVARNCRSSAGFFAGLPEAPVKNVVIENCSFAIGGELVNTDLSEMFKGLEHIENRSIRIENADVIMKNSKVSLGEY